MIDYTFKVDLSDITSEECFKEASKDELKVLVALIARSGAETTAELLANELGISRARVMAAITLFEESGIISKCTDASHAEIEYEFEPKKNEKVVGSAEQANDCILRNREFSDSLVEIEKLFEKTLAAREIERLGTFINEKGVSLEYVLHLAAHLKDKYQNLTVERVVREGTRLFESNITTFEELELYIKEKTEEIPGEMEMYSLFHIYNRKFTKTEREYLKKWLHEYGYGKVIIEEAYDISAVATSSRSFPYIDSILTSWHEAGCKTLEECKAREAMHKQTSNAKNANKNSHKTKKAVEAETPKYTDFNSEDALMRALERSYGDSNG